MATDFTANPQGGEQAFASVGTTWTTVRFKNPRVRRITTTSEVGVDHYVGRGQTEGGAASGHSPNVGGSPFGTFLGAWTAAEHAQGYRDVQIAVTTGTGTIYVRAEPA